MWCICSNFPTKNDYDGSLEKIQNIYWIWFSINNQISWTINERLIYSSICWLSFCWISFFNIKGMKKNNWKKILVGMNYHHLVLILIQKNVNWKFKWWFICKLVNRLSYAFTNTKRVTKSHIRVFNAPIELILIYHTLEAW